MFDQDDSAIEYESGDDLSDYDPNEVQNIEENLENDSENELSDDETTNESDQRENIALLSKNKNIQYSLEPPPVARPPPSRVGVIANQGKFIFPL